MKRFPLLILLLVCSAVSAQKVVFMPQWMAQTQFAGYYVAYEKGFYEEEGLDVIFEHMNRNIPRTQFDDLMSGEVQIISMSLLQAAQKRDAGHPLVNVLQLGQNNPDYCIMDKPVTQISDLNGCRIAKWRRGDIQMFSLIQKKYNLDIEWIPCTDGCELYLFKAVDGILATSYNEYYKLETSIGKIDPRCILKPSEIGYNYPSDGLYVREDYYQKNKDVIGRFIKATIKGWNYADRNRDEAVEITRKWMQKTNNTSSLYHSRMMLQEVLELMVNPKTGKMDFAPMDRELFRNMVSESVDAGFFKQNIDYSELIKTDILEGIENED